VRALRRALVTLAAFGWLAGAAGLARAAETPGEAEEKTAEHLEEHGGEHEAIPEIHGTRLIAQILNFGAVIFVIVYFGGKAISKMLVTRHEQLKSELAAASEAKAAAEARLAKEEKRLAALEQEITAMRAGIKQEAEAEKARLIEMAEERAQRIREETKFLLDQQVKEAEATLRRDAARAAVDMAEAIVRKSLNAGDQQRMVDSFVSDVAAPAGGGGRPTTRSAS
jgi:F0F1-type ATP synthase membrane subunit b/b'